MSRPTILRVPPLSPQLHDAVAERYDAVDPGDLATRAGDVVGIVVSNSGPVSGELIASLPRLGVIANHGVGYDNIDLAAALDRGIAVSNTPEVLDDAVAETALALLLAVRRRVVVADRFVREGQWLQGAFPLTDQLAGSRVGILGLGRIGRAVATRLEAFGCTVSYHNRRQVPGVPYAYATSAVELAESVDSLVAVVPGGDDTAALVDRAVLDALGPAGVLVNIARGSVVDQRALVDALHEGRLGGAGLDVYADEPHVPVELTTMDNVVLLPHVGSATHATRAAMRALTLDNLASWLADGTLRTPIPEMADQPAQ
ncbi:MULTISPECIES: 2-hydroxyacid dehydrogenase [unclassified Nocardioides]|uniref:2-hydroxyacid dehydrogenase n=1 Tax=unclassified Nocardioides TaxID=2615069 RepID=UPI0007031BF1|nr:MULTISPECIES: 2-hydroxyacid dehydrogenase [unclassified Nocardioides]KRC56975.1 hydroxyacid dehydrogenase [Nocardioides sp. Root79]KRC77184.1 hydroxyacid dehydrogenase [Nocardioides sp. Root240]